MLQMHKSKSIAKVFCFNEKEEIIRLSKYSYLFHMEKMNQERNFIPRGINKQISSQFLQKKICTEGENNCKLS